MKALSVCGFIANINFELLKVLSVLYTSAQAEQFCDEKNLKKVKSQEDDDGISYVMFETVKTG